MKKYLSISALALTGVLLWSCTSKQEKMENKLKAFIEKHEATIQPLSKEAAIAYWNASISGKDEDYAKMEELNVKLTGVYTSKEAFAELKEIKESGAVKDSLLLRQLDIIYSQFLGNQVDTAKLNRKIKMETEIEKKYSNFRAMVNGKAVSDNEVEGILKKSTNNKELQAAWEGHKQIGPLVADDLKALVKLRNEIAKDLGFANYHEMSLKLGDQDPAEVSALFDELDSLTRGAFAQLKDEMDTYFAKRYKVNKADLKPWHYQNRFFQEAPVIYPVDLDKYYEKQDIVKLTATFYNSVGLNVDDVIANSDLFEKPGKNQHAYCMDVDREGDVRSLNNVKQNSDWMGTMLHEFGHGVYSKFNDRTLPFELRTQAHTFTTEAIAMIFGRFSTNPVWMKDMGIIDSTESVKIADDCRKTLRLQQLVFSRWAQVMYRFEKGMYENPDQDLNKLWWDLVEKYQMIKKPEGRNMPDYATKVHIATFPCYYHNYLLGELLASQLYYHITSKVLKSDDYVNQSFVNRPEVGEYLKTKVFMPGARYYWNDMIERATGEKLTAKYYAKQFVE